MQRQELEKERQLLEEERDKSMNQIKQLEKRGTRKMRQPTVGQDDSDSYKSTLSRPLLDVSQDEEDSIDNEIKKNRNNLENQKNIGRQETFARGREFVEGSDDETAPPRKYKETDNNRRISFGIESQAP